MPKTVLLADDSVTIQKVVGISFASEDVEITAVDNGNDALAKAHQLRPDVILADVVMPGLSGYEVCEAVKAEPTLRHIPVLLLTGTFEAFDESRATAAGAAGHIAKPFEAQTLVERVKQLLASAPPAAADVAPASPERATPAADATAGTDGGAPDAFDFFTDDEPSSDEADAFSTGGLDLDGPDTAFSFGDEDLASSVQESLAAPPPAPDATVAILPDAPAPAREDAFSFDDLAPAEAADAPMSPDELCHTALLDPAAAAGLDVSSSDLAVDFSTGPAAASPVVESPPGPAASPADPRNLTEPQPPAEPAAPPLPSDPVMRALTSPPETQTAPLPRPFGVEPDPGDTLPRRSPVPEAAAISEAEPFASEALHTEPIDLDPIEAESGEAELASAGAVAPEALVPPAVAQPAASSVADPATAKAGALSPAMREELHDTLERIAWDAFGQVTEKVVQEAIARIERVAWEVVPKLAETLIEEEIRRLKGGE